MKVFLATLLITLGALLLLWNLSGSMTALAFSVSLILAGLLLLIAPFGEGK